MKLLIAVVLLAVIVIGVNKILATGGPSGAAPAPKA